MVYQILTAGISVPKQQRKRVWLELGVPVTVAPRLAMRITTEREGEEYVLVVSLTGPNADYSAPLGPAECLNMGGWCGMWLIPRALALDALERPRRVLVELVAVRPDVKFAV